MEKEDRLQYIAGLFDGGGNIYYKIRECDNKAGYKINPVIGINVNSDSLYGFLHKFLIDNQIMYIISENANSKRVEITKKENIQRFIELINDYIIQHKVCSKFILDVFYPEINKNTISKYKFTKLLRTIEKTQPRRKFGDNIKYCTNYFDNIWEEVGCNESYNIECETTNNIEYTYISGLFDGCGKIRPVVIRSKSHNSDYTVKIRLDIVRYWMKNSLVENLEQKLNRDDIKYNKRKNSKKYNINITKVDSIDEFLLKTQSNLISNYEVTILTRKKIIPAIKDDYNEKRQGVHDIIQLYETVIDDNTDKRKYTSEFFREKWDNVEKIDFHK